MSNVQLVHRKRQRETGVGLLGGRRRSGAAAAVAVLETRRQDGDLQLSICRAPRRIFRERFRKGFVRTVTSWR